MKPYKRSSINLNFWGCPECDWPLEPDEIDIINGFIYCPGGRLIELPNPPIPDKKEKKDVQANS